MNINNRKNLITAVNNGLKPKYIFFWSSQGNGIGKHCLSQFYTAPFIVDGITYSSAEQFYMAQKARLFNDQEMLAKILKNNSPLTIKKLGRKVKNFNEHEWEKYRFEMAGKGNFAKFHQNPELKEYLKTTGNSILVEASPLDCIWGIGLAEDNPAINDPKKWLGENLLGFALMKVRGELK
jgi:ribA/ribD-fused uncharacterized protein